MHLTPIQHRIADHLAAQAPAVVESGDEGEWASVAVILVPDPDAVLLIHRAERVGDPWSGHIGLPGGRRDPNDPDLLSTAIRETSEEVGLSLSPTQLLGPLPDVWPGTPLPRVITVRPWVFALPSRQELQLSGEVSETFWVPLSQLATPGVYFDTDIELRGERRRFPAYHLSGHTIWGLTERILTPLLALV